MDVFSGPNAVTTVGNLYQRPTVAQDRQGPNRGFGRLVMVDRRVDGDEYFVGLRHRDAHGLRQGGGGLLKGEAPMASVHPGELLLLIHRDVNEEIGPDTFGHLRRFLMAGIAGQDEIRGAGVLQELGAMKFLQRGQIRQPWTDRLASTGKAGHKVRLDLTCENLDVSIEVVCINIHVRTTRGTSDKTE